MRALQEKAVGVRVVECAGAKQRVRAESRGRGAAVEDAPPPERGQEEDVPVRHLAGRGAGALPRRGELDADGRRGAHHQDRRLALGCLSLRFLPGRISLTLLLGPVSISFATVVVISS